MKEGMVFLVVVFRIIKFYKKSSKVKSIL